MQQQQQPPLWPRGGWPQHAGAAPFGGQGSASDAHARYSSFPVPQPLWYGPPSHAAAGGSSANSPLMASQDAAAAAVAGRPTAGLPPLGGWTHADDAAGAAGGWGPGASPGAGSYGAPPPWRDASAGGSFGSPTAAAAAAAAEAAAANSCSSITRPQRGQQDKSRKEAYRAELEAQIAERAARKAADKRARNIEDAAKEAEMATYSPWGKGGAGAPLRDAAGQVRVASRPAL
jgi:hypothetical protein